MLDSVGTQQQAAPSGDGADVTELVLKDLIDRREAGTRKYGTALRTFNGRNALVDAYQEATDLTVYLRQKIEEDRAPKVWPLIYLASPYSHPDPAMRVARFESACRATSRLMKTGMLVFSPIAQSHSVAIHGGTPVDWAFWEAYDTAVLAGCGKLLVLKLDGWDRSVGVGAEINIMLRAGKPVEYIEPDPSDL